MRMDKDICKVMFNEVELQGVCKRLGEQITKDYEGKDLLIVGILNGAIVFVTDLMRQIDRQINIDFMSVSSYGSGTTSSDGYALAACLRHPGEKIKLRDYILQNAHGGRSYHRDCRYLHYRGILRAVLLYHGAQHAHRHRERGGFNYLRHISHRACR